MRRKAIIRSEIPGLTTSIDLKILVETGENTNNFEFRGFHRFYRFTEIENVKAFAHKYCEIVEIQ